MKYVPMSLTRFGSRSVLKLRKNSPTIMVVGGVVGLGATAIMAAKATRKIDPILENHKKQRFDLEVEATDHQQSVDQKSVVRLYSDTTFQLTKIYAPTLIVGALSATSVLSGHKILNARHVATMMAYTGLMEQYQSYRERVSETIGPELERDLHAGAVGKWEEDPEHPGEAKLKAKFVDQPDSYLRPLFDESNKNWTRDPSANKMFLTAVQNHANRKLQINGYVFLSDVYESLGMEKTKETIVTGWVLDGNGDGFIDFGFMTDPSQQAVMFRNGTERSVWLNFNIDGVIWDLI